MGRLADRVALITGGAGGIGLGAAKVFLEEGAQVVVIDKDEHRLAAALGELAHERLSGICADLTLESEHRRYVDEILERFDRIDAAVFNAGIEGANMPLEEYPVELFDAVLAVNLRAVWLGLRTVIPVMKRGEGGSIVLTSSVQGLAAIGGTTAYTTSKHALVGMMKGASLELAPFNIRVNTVHPGYVATPMMDRIHRSAAPEQPGDFADMLAGTVPMRRYARPEEIGRLMAFLASDDSSYSTGAEFIADGGMLASLP